MTKQETKNKIKRKMGESTKPVQEEVPKDSEKSLIQ